MTDFVEVARRREVVARRLVADARLHRDAGRLVVMAGFRRAAIPAR